MKHKTLFLLLSFASLSVSAQPLHLDPEMTGAEYRQIFQNLEKNTRFRQRVNADPLNEILSIGKRNLDWINLINSKRDAQHQLQLTTPDKVVAYPIDKPNVTNRTSIQSTFKNLREIIPKPMADILFSHSELTDQAPIDDEQFIYYAFKLNRAYEAASRWLLQEPYLEEYKEHAQMDIRGYYFLSKETDLENKLKITTDPTKIIPYANWLIGECYNSTGNREQCDHDLLVAIKAKTVFEYHQKYVTDAAKMYHNIFELYQPRTDVTWNAQHPDVMEMLFTKPETKEVQDWFKSNVEDEFKLDNWSLKINYSHHDNLAKVVFEPATTPHVDGLGSQGTTIFMDANRNINDYEVSWTIRHEFGHILGFRDCYLEFYDVKEQAMINYQIDTTNIMCSRRGHLQAQHVEQLKKYYFTANRH
jgi:hypothetical protein